MFNVDLLVIAALPVLVFGKIAVHPDDPYSHLAASASSYAEWAELIIAATTTTEVKAVPSPIVSAEQQYAIEVLANGTSPHPFSRLFARQNSNVICGVNTYCYAPDAAWCVSYLAGLGGQGCVVDSSGTQMCHHGDAQIVGLAYEGRTSASCNDVAIAGGHILDQCTRSDSMTTGQKLVDTNSVFNVIITKS